MTGPRVRSLRTTDSRTAERAALPLMEEAHRFVDAARQAIIFGRGTCRGDRRNRLYEREIDQLALRLDIAWPTGRGVAEEAVASSHLDLPHGKSRP